MWHGSILVYCKVHSIVQVLELIDFTIASYFIISVFSLAQDTSTTNRSPKFIIKNLLKLRKTENQPYESHIKKCAIALFILKLILKTQSSNKYWLNKQMKKKRNSYALTWSAIDLWRLSKFGFVWLVPSVKFKACSIVDTQHWMNWWNSSTNTKR